eukprot:5518003-Amphidinium_carterae.5
MVSMWNVTGGGDLSEMCGEEGEGDVRCVVPKGGMKCVRAGFVDITGFEGGSDVVFGEDGWSVIGEYGGVVESVRLKWWRSGGGGGSDGGSGNVSCGEVSRVANVGVEMCGPMVEPCGVDLCRVHSDSGGVADAQSRRGWGFAFVRELPDNLICSLGVGPIVRSFLALGVKPSPFVSSCQVPGQGIVVVVVRERGYDWETLVDGGEDALRGHGAMLKIHDVIVDVFELLRWCGGRSVLVVDWRRMCRVEPMLKRRLEVLLVKFIGKGGDRPVAATRQRAGVRTPTHKLWRQKHEVNLIEQRAEWSGPWVLPRGVRAVKRGKERVAKVEVMRHDGGEGSGEM